MGIMYNGWSSTASNPLKDLKYKFQEKFGYLKYTKSLSK